MVSSARQHRVLLSNRTDEGFIRGLVGPVGRQMRRGRVFRHHHTAGWRKTVPHSDALLDKPPNTLRRRALLDLKRFGANKGANKGAG
jgi:hypothetical protein